MKTQVRNRLTMTKSIVSARMDATRPDSYAWIWITPMRDGSYKVSTVELWRDLVDNGVCSFEGDITRNHVGILSDVAEIDDFVRRLGVDPDTLDGPWHNGFPL